MRPKRPPGPPGRVKSRWEISPEAPRTIALNFGGRPTRLGSLPGKLLGPTGRPRGSRRPPGANLAPKLVPKWSPQGSFLELFSPLWERWCSILLVSVIVDCCLRDFSRFSNGASFLDTLGLYFGHLRPWLSQASRLCRCLAFAWGCFPSLFPPCALRSVAGSPGKYPPSTCRVPRIGPAECAKRLNNRSQKMTFQNLPEIT